jgi:putative phosphoesterase
VRVAALYDIHGNLPALEAVLAEVDADLIVVGGDVAPGPLVDECFERLDALDVPVRWVLGNGDREDLDAERLARFEPTVTLEIDGIGSVLFCHGSPRSDEEIITQITPPERLAPMLDGVSADLVVCGHTHHQFDLGRVVNAGSVGLPYQGDAAAFWLSLGPKVEFRRTAYDVEQAVQLFRAIPELEESAQASFVEPISAQAIAEHFEPR